jgi:hypothetical protein
MSTPTGETSPTKQAYEFETGSGMLNTTDLEIIPGRLQTKREREIRKIALVIALFFISMDKEEKKRTINKIKNLKVSDRHNQP